MRYYLFLLVCFICFSCNSKKQNQNNQQPAVPEALQDNNKKPLFASKTRYEDDLVEELYEEKLKQSSELQTIEKRIKELKESKSDSTEVFNFFKNKNLQYYETAQSSRYSIQDSLLKNEIDAALARSKTMFQNKIVELERLQEMLEKRSFAISDRHHVLKLFISLGMMEQYQKENMPSPKPIISVLNDQNKLMNKLDSAINKNK